MHEWHILNLTSSDQLILRAGIMLFI